MEEAYRSWMEENKPIRLNKEIIHSIINNYISYKV